MVRFRLTLATPPEAPETRLALRVLVLLDGDVIERQSFVFCPFRAASRGVSDCLRCADFARVERREMLVCAREPPLTDAEAAELVSDRQICSGSHSLAARTPIGVVAENVIVCATPTTTVAVADAVVSGSASPGVVVVVDEARRPMAFVTRSCLAQESAAGVRILANCRDEAFTIFDERDPLAYAVDRLVHERRRTGITVDADGRATGLVSDLDVLRWLARTAHGHMSGA